MTTTPAPPACASAQKPNVNEVWRFWKSIAVVTRDYRTWLLGNPYDFALLLGPAYQPDMLRNAEFNAMAKRVRITENDDYEKQYPARSLCRVTIRLRRGESHSIEVDRTEIARYLNPSDADIENKFRLIATPVLGRARADKVVNLVQGFEKLANVDELMDALQPI